MSNLLKTRDSWCSEKIEASKVSGLLKISLWGNKCDLSISAGTSQSFHHDPLEQIDLFKSRLLVDDSDDIVDYILEKSQAGTVDIIMDNAGFELISDLCLADYLTSCKAVKK